MVVDIEKQNLSIFDFIEEDVNDIIKNIDDGNISFVDKSFDDILLPKVFDLVGIKYIKDLNYYNLKNILKQMKKNQQERFTSFINLVMNGINYFLDKLDYAIKNIENFNILLMRSNGIKLNMIGESLQLTKERIRQLESKAVDDVMIYINTYLNVLNKEKKFDNIMFFDFNDIFHYVGDNDTKKVIIYAIMQNKKYDFAIFDNDFSCFVNINKLASVNEIKNMINLENYFNYYDTYESLNNKLVFDMNILDFRINIYLAYLKNKNYLFRGNLCYKFSKCSINQIISMVIKNYYKDGIILDEQGIKSFQNFTNKLLNYNFKLNSAVSKIDELNPELILWGKLKRCHIDNVIISEDKLKSILNKFESIFDDCNYLLFEQVFNLMACELQGTVLDDKYKLYGFLKYHFQGQYYFKKMAVRRMDLKNYTLSDLVYEYIVNNDMCTKDDIATSLLINKSSLFQVYKDLPCIICIKDKHTIFDRLNICDNFKDYLKKLIDDNIKEGYVHRDRLFDLIDPKYNITDDTMLYHLIRYYFLNDYVFNNPYIQTKSYDKVVSTKSIILDIFDKYDYVVDYNVITKEVIERSKAKDFSLVYYLRISQIDFFRMNKSLITINDKIEVDDIVNYMINNRLKNYFKNNDYAYLNDINELSKGLYYYISSSNGRKKYSMNLYSLASYIESNKDLKYYIINSYSLNNFYESTYIISKNQTTLVDIIYKTIKKNSIENVILRKDALKLLRDLTICNTLPQALVVEGYIEYDNTNANEVYLRMLK